MATSKVALEKEDHKRDADFNKALHGQSAVAAGGFAAMFAKDKNAKKVAVDEYFKHFDNKTAADETDADRAVGTAFPIYAAGMPQSLTCLLRLARPSMQP